MLDRETVLRGLDDGVQMSLGSDVGLICAVRSIGKCEGGYLTSSVVLTGEELIKFLDENRPVPCPQDWLDPLAAKIDPKKRYELTAYDW